MDFKSILGGVKCECGKTHTCNIEQVYIEKGAVAKLAELCKDYNSIILVADGNTYGAAGEKTEKALEGKG